MNDMANSLGLYATYNLLLTTKPCDFSEETEENMTDEAWDLWSRSLYDYPDDLVPKSVLTSYLDDIEAETDGYY